MAEGSGAHRPRREWASIIKRDLEPHVKTTTSWTRRKPFLRVGSRLRELRREQFVPQHLFLGLYQRSSYDHNDQKSRGNIFKLAVVGAFLADSGKALDDWEEISASIVEEPQAVLDMYNEDGLDDFSTEDVRSVLSLDAIVLAWFFTKLQFDEGLSGVLFSRFPSVHSVIQGIGRTFVEHFTIDMLKLENQIPLELIRNALELFFKILNEEDGNQRLASSVNRRDIGDAETQAHKLLENVCVFVASARDIELPGSISSTSISEVKATLNFNNCEHFLHCVYLGLINERSDETEQGTRAAPESFPAAVHRALKYCFSRRLNPFSSISAGNVRNSNSRNWFDEQASSIQNTDPALDSSFAFMNASSTMKSQHDASADPTGNASESPSGNSGNSESFRNVHGNLSGDVCDISSRNWSGNSSHNLPASFQSEERMDAAPHPLWSSALAVLQCCFWWRKKGRASTRRETTIFGSPLASASLLRKAGINFRGKTGLEPQFKKHLLGATLYLPRIYYLGDTTEGMWRNLLAFEDQDGLQHPFKSYLFFMDELIDLEEDVVLLRHGRNPVIVNVGVGSNAEVARIFNSMTTDYYEESNDKWSRVRGQVLDYYNNKSRQTWVEFRRTNFGKPWLFASFLAAVGLLVLTFLQTYYAMLSYYETHF